jgi:hypothetical protein
MVTSLSTHFGPDPFRACSPKLLLPRVGARRPARARGDHAAYFVVAEALTKVGELRVESPVDGGTLVAAAILARLARGPVERSRVHCCSEARAVAGLALNPLPVALVADCVHDRTSWCRLE